MLAHRIYRRLEAKRLVVGDNARPDVLGRSPKQYFSKQNVRAFTLLPGAQKNVMFRLTEAGKNHY